MKKQVKNTLSLGLITKWMAIVAIVTILSCCGGGSNVSSLYGTYTGTDDYGNTICITLRPESDNEWRKYGDDRSSNLVFTDSEGRTRHTDQSIKWTWDFDQGYVQTYYLGNERTIIDFKHKRFYKKYGEFIDGRNGIPYTFSKQ